MNPNHQQQIILPHLLIDFRGRTPQTAVGGPELHVFVVFCNYTDLVLLKKRNVNTWNQPRGLDAVSLGLNTYELVLETNVSVCTVQSLPDLSAYE